jgi:hypothetical protein
MSLQQSPEMVKLFEVYTDAPESIGMHLICNPPGSDQPSDRAVSQCLSVNRSKRGRSHSPKQESIIEQEKRAGEVTLSPVPLQERDRVVPSGSSYRSTGGDW